MSNPFADSVASAGNPFADSAAPSGGADDGSGFLHPESALASSRGLDASEWSKERSMQQLELSDAHDGDGPGICGRCAEYGVAALHVVNICCGIASIVYGSLLASQFEPPARGAAMFTLMIGTIHVATSGLGALSYFLASCSRWGLLASAYVGPYVAFVYLTIVISWMGNEPGFLGYLDAHKEDMYLGPDVAENVEGLMPLLYTIIIVLGILEALRFCVMVRLRDRLLRRDSAESLVPGGASVAASARSKGTARSRGRGNAGLTEALLEGDGTDETSAASGAVGRESTGAPSWWENEE